MKKYEDALLALAALEGGAELVEAVKERVHDVNGEAKNLRDRAKAAEAKLVDAEKVAQWAKAVAEKVGVEVGVEVPDDLLKGGKQSSELERTLNTVQKQLKDLTVKLETTEQEKIEITKKSRQARASEALTKAIGGKVVAPEYVIKGLLNDGTVKVSDDDKLVFVDNGKELDFMAGVEGWLKANSPLVIDAQRPGSGSSGTGGGAEQGKKKMQRGNFDALPPNEQAAFMGAGGTLYD